MSAPQVGFDPQHFLKTLTSRPGVYRMLDGQGRVLYVGKARNLNKRVASYFRSPEQLVPKTRAMMAQVASVEVTVTRTEGEALLLEDNLIKDLKPRYNILLRDDKSYPYIYLTSHQDYPRLSLHRGARSGPGRYFGPYPSAGAVRETLGLLQKLFRIRQCEDSFFANRSRPCLQHQIKRCTGPCVGLVQAAEYQQDVHHAILFLEGKSSEVIGELVRRMDQAAQTLEFERAARYRDQITSLRRVQERQYVAAERGDLDLVTAAARQGVGCVQVFFFRGGRSLGNKTYFPRQTAQADSAELLAAFLPQFYLAPKGGREVPAEILVSEDFEDRETLTAVLCQRMGRRVGIAVPVRGDKARWMDMARENTLLALGQRLSSTDDTRLRLESAREALDLEETPGRVECFDISHSAGESAVASCVVFGPDGALTGEYRRFNIEGIAGGDDYAAMHQALKRRYTRVRREEGRLPDLLLIDGGKGQVAQAGQVLSELQIEGVTVVGVAKGSSRKPGLERLFLPDHEAPLILPADSPALHLIQQVRDEAHRFAISAHRRRRARSRKGSVLEDIPGIGPRRRQRLLSQFGGLQGLARAGVADLAGVEGVSEHLARRIYDALHPE